MDLVASTRKIVDQQCRIWLLEQKLCSRLLWIVGEVDLVIVCGSGSILFVDLVASTRKIVDQQCRIGSSSRCMSSVFLVVTCELRHRLGKVMVSLFGFRAAAFVPPTRTTVRGFQWNEEGNVAACVACITTSTVQHMMESHSSKFSPARAIEVRSKNNVDIL